MKKLIFMTMLLFAVSFAFAQNITEKYSEPLLKTDTGIIPIKVGNKWKKMSDTDNRFNPFRTVYGNPSSKDSTAILHNLKVYKDSINLKNINLSLSDGYINTKFREGLYFGKWASSLQTPTLLLKTDGVNEDAALLIRSRIDTRGNTTGTWMFLYNKFIDYYQYAHTDTNEPYYDIFVTRDTIKNNDGIYRFVYRTKNVYNSDFEQIVEKVEVSNNEATWKLQGISGNETGFIAISESKIDANKILNANAGIKLATLSYTPTSSTNLTAEASTAAVGTMWLKDISGTTYLITKISSTKLARTTFAEW